MSANLKTAALFQLSAVALFWSPVAGSLVALAAIATHLVLIRSGDWLNVAMFAVVGTLGESVLTRAGLVRFSADATVPGLCPLWVAVFWAALGTLASGPLALLLHRRAFAFAAGLVGGPVSFFVSERLGVLALASPLPLTLAVLAGAMMLAVGLLFEAARRLE